MAVPLSSLLSSKLLIHHTYYEQALIDCIEQRKQASTVDFNRVSTSYGTLISLSGVTLTNDLQQVQPDSEVVFLHEIRGAIFTDQYYRYKYDYKEGCWILTPYFSTRTFIENLKEAERSPEVVAHLLYINSGGGEAYLLDEAFATMRACKKPIYAYVECACCSAAYYLAAGAQVIKVMNRFDQIGSIGTMCSYVDIQGYLEKNGIKEIELYATKSDLKNKVFRDVLEGNTQAFIETFLDPVQIQFETNVRQSRPALAALPDDHPALRGEVFYAPEAQKIGLIDGMVSGFPQAIIEAYKLGMSYRDSNHMLSTL